MAIVNQKLWISSVGVLQLFQNIPSSSLLETDSQVDLAATVNASHRGHSVSCNILPLSIILSSVMSTLPIRSPSFLTNSHLHLSLFPCHFAYYLIPPLSIILPHYIMDELLYRLLYKQAVVNSGLDLPVILYVCGRVKLRMFPVTSVSSMSSAESRHNGFFIEVLLFSFFMV